MSGFKIFTVSGTHPSNLYRYWKGDIWKKIVKHRYILTEKKFSSVNTYHNSSISLYGIISSILFEMANIMYLRRRPWFHTGLSNSKPEVPGIHESQLCKVSTRRYSNTVFVWFFWTTDNFKTSHSLFEPHTASWSARKIENEWSWRRRMFFVCPKSRQWEDEFFCHLRKDFVLDQRVLRRDLLRVESRVKSLLSFDTRSVELQDKFDWIFTLVCFICPLSEQKNCLHLFKFCESELSTCVSGRRCLICGSRSWGRTVWSPEQEKK